MVDNTLYADGLVFPTPSLASESRGVGLSGSAPTLVSGSTGGGLVAASPTLSAAMLGFAAELTAPVISLSITMAAESPVIIASLLAPAPTIVIEVFTGGVGTARLTAPLPTVESHTKDAVLTAPVPVLLATAVVGTISSAVLTAPVSLLIATLASTNIITAANTAALPQLSAALAQGNILTAALLAPAPKATISVCAGGLMTAALTAPAPTLSSTGYPAYTLTFAGVAPVPYLEAVLSGATTTDYRTWVINTRKQALTEYDSHEFNSYANFNGLTLACGPSGVVSLGTQSQDGSTAIDAIVRTGQNDYDHSLMKRVPRLYVALKADGDVKFRTILSETGTRTYLLPWNHVAGFQQRRVPVGKGPKSTHWQYEVENVDGADFSLQNILVYPTILKRRVQ